MGGIMLLVTLRCLPHGVSSPVAGQASLATLHTGERELKCKL